MEPKDVLQELLDLETAGWDALCDGTASDFCGRLMHDDALMVLANGMVLDRPGVVDALQQSPPWDSYAIDDPRAIAAGADAAVLVYTGTAHREGAEPFVAVMSSVYVRHATGWKLALYQQTPDSGADRAGGQ
jgi:hypothetical protein